MLKKRKANQRIDLIKETRRFYHVEFDLYVDKLWVEDGLTAKTLQRRIKDELPSDLCQSHIGDEIEVKNIKVRLKQRQ